MNLQNKVAFIFKEKSSNFFSGDFVNLDFHSIPHHDEESERERVWCWDRDKTMKDANTIFTIDIQNNAYTRRPI